MYQRTRHGSNDGVDMAAIGFSNCHHQVVLRNPTVNLMVAVDGILSDLHTHFPDWWNE
jgi:hypothetical protein